MVKLLFFFILFIGIIRTYGKFDDLKDKHNLGQLTTNEIQYLSKLQDWDEFKKDLEKILIPRVVGTKGHTEVYEYIKNTLEQLNYNVEIDLFTDNTPFGNLTFKNIIATLNPESERFFVIAAHYDSKYFQNGKFVGATDSAVPCAMMLQLAKVFKNFNFPKKEDVSLKLIFFDGEEAFVNWGPKDSIYGAKHLAVKMQRGRSRSSLTGEMVNDLQRIDCLMLLDLLGASNPKFYNYFDDTEELYTMLANSEKKLYQLGLLKRTSSPYFIKRTRNSYIEDDHIPFYQRNVPILHVIPTPFPDAWHTVHDNDDILDPDVIQDLGLTIQLFVARYLHILTDDDYGDSSDAFINKTSLLSIVVLIFISSFCS